eukprot:805761_1
MAGFDNRKCVMVGDSGVGKTCLLMAYVTNAFPDPDQYIPRIFQNISMMETVDDYQVFIGVFDTNGSRDPVQNRLRSLYYPHTDLVLICFDVMNRESFQNCEIIWSKEIERHLPKTPVLLIGNKMDLADELVHVTRDQVTIIMQRYAHLILPNAIINLCVKYYYLDLPISHEECTEMAIKIGACAYFRTSASTQLRDGLTTVFHETIRTVWRCKNHTNKQQKKRCVTM